MPRAFFARAALAALLCSPLAAAPAWAIGPLGWILLDQALSRALSPASNASPPNAQQRQLLFEQTARAAQILNQSLPAEAGPGLSASRAQASGPAELEVEFVASQATPAELSGELVDQRWGAGIRSEICRSPFFQAWLSQGGTLRLSVRGRDASLARQYFANETDCPR